MPRFALILLMLALPVGLFAACGGDDDAAKTSEPSTSRVTTMAPATTVAVALIEYRVTPDKLSVVAGVTKFVATNTSASMTHELAVLLVKPDGSFENTGEIEDIGPGQTKDVSLELPAGKYVLACLIAPGESGSTTDHFKEGMKIDFEVK